MQASLPHRVAEMISVCVATFNGARYVVEQLQSILPQLSPDDEIIVSDDGSSDATVELVNSLNDSRIHVLCEAGGLGVVRNFERSLGAARGNLVFLCDQDDVWLPNKVNIFVDALRSADLVVSDCHVTDSELSITCISFFSLHGSRPGVLKNVWQNSYLGCCMAFRREILKAALPFPQTVPMHDMWIGLLADAMYRVIFVETPTLLHRRHDGNASSTAERSHFGLTKKVRYRVALAWAVFSRVLSLKLSGSGLG